MKKAISGLVLFSLAGFLAAGLSGRLLIFLVCFPLAAWALLAALILAAAALFLRLGRRGRTAFIFLAAAAVFLAAVRGLLVTSADPAERRSSLSDLTSLPYLSWVKSRGEAGEQGAAILDRARAGEGLNLYSPRHLPAAFLIDREGEVVRSWSLDYFGGEGWHHVAPAGDGGLFAIVRDRGLLRLDRGSNLVWAFPGRAHHDLAISPDGEIFLLLSQEELVRWRGIPLPVVNDLIVRLSPEGELQEEIPLYPLLADRVTAERVKLIYRDLLKPARVLDFIKARLRSRPPLADHLPYDIFHVNTLGLLGRDLPGVGEEGDILFCSLMLDLVGTIDREGSAVTWSWGPGELDKPHQPTIVENGNILIFDNGYFRGWSRVIELDPAAGEIVWEYTASPPEKFFTATRGGAQRLAGGNTLITESNSGYVFEVTPEGEKVWEFYSPEIDGDSGSRAAIYRMTRLDF
ncbi:MAG: arylsulfotransferase family protein [Candidatus Erginobacter occultus]|nr:arylsulfotransferase family protein [Candidatus Erginobacter occultus]